MPSYTNEAETFQPITESDECIRAALADLATTVLMLSVVHITGRLDIIRNAPAAKLPLYSGDGTGGFTPEQKQAILDEAVAAVCQWRDAGCPPPYRPRDAELHEMMSYLAGAPLDSRYVPMLKEELGPDGDARQFSWDQPVDKEKLDAFPVLIIGAGMSGLLNGFRLKQAGIPFTIVEKNPEVGGTWYENRYPGCRVDVPSHCYSFSFLRNYNWPNQFSPQPVLNRYFKQFADTFALREHIRFETEVLGASFDEQAAEWEIRLRGAKGEETLRARAVISAVGQLNKPAVPEIKGCESFTGHQFHTARWRDDVELEGKRIAVVGTAATAVQLIPELAKVASQLTVFQRTPNWIIIHPEYRKEFGEAEEWALTHLPFYARWYRVMNYGWGIDGSPAHLKIDPDWPQDGLSVSAANEDRRVRLTANIRAAIGEEHTDLLDKVIPKYPPFVKRPNPGDGGYYRALLQDNVELVTDGVQEIVAQGLIDSSGRQHEFDIIVYATGFKAMDFLAPMEIRGVDGVNIKEFWGDDPGAYLGMTVPGFPNFYMMYGPGTNLGFNGNLIFNSECQTRYITESFRHQILNDLPAIEVKESVYQDYGQRMEEALEGFTWSHGSTGNWYKNSRGKVIANSPWSLLDYWDWTRKPNFAEFNVVTLASAQAGSAAAVK